MEYVKGRIIKVLVDFFEKDIKRIAHALEVLKYAEKIAEDKSGYDFDVLVAVALLHDIGIKPSEAELGYNNGVTQERYGPPIAEHLLKSIGFPDHKIKKVHEIVGNHHSPSRYDYIELEILKEADRIVNKNESRLEKDKT